MAGDEVIFPVRAPTGAIKADMAETMAVIDRALNDVSAKSAKIKVEVDQASLAKMRADIDRELAQVRANSANVSGSAGGVSGSATGSSGLLDTAISIRATYRAIEAAVHGIEAGVSFWNAMSANISTEGEKALKNIESFADSAQRIPIVGNLLAEPIRGVEAAAKAAEKALKDEEETAKRIQQHTEQRQKNEQSAQDQIRLMTARAQGPDAEREMRAQLEFEKTIRTVEDQFQRGLISGETKDRLKNAAEQDKNNAIFGVRDEQTERTLQSVKEFEQLRLELSGQTDEAARRKFIEEWDKRIREAKAKNRQVDAETLEDNKELAVKLFDNRVEAKKQAEHIKEEVDKEMKQAEEEAKDKKEQADKLEKNMLQQSRFEVRKTAELERDFKNIQERRARTTFEEVSGSRTDLSGGRGGATIEDSVEQEKKIVDQLILLNGKAPIVLKIF